MALKVHREKWQPFWSVRTVLPRTQKLWLVSRSGFISKTSASQKVDAFKEICAVRHPRTKKVTIVHCKKKFDSEKVILNIKMILK